MDEESNGLVPVAQLRRIAESLGFTEKKVNNDLIIYTRANVTPVQLTNAPLDAVIAGGEPVSTTQSTELARLLPCTFECYLKTGDVCTYLPHPRQKAYRLFHLGALHSPETFTAVLHDPWSDLQFSYRFSDMLNKPSEAVPSAPPPLPAATAIERQLAVIEREINDLRVERQELKRRMKQVGHSLGANSSVLGADDGDSARDGKYESDDTGFSQKHGGARHRSAHKDLTAARAITPDRSRRRHASADQESFANFGSRAGDHSTGGHDEDLAGDGQYTSRVSADRVRGNKGIWSMFFPDAQEDFARAWSFKPVSLVALGRGYVVVYEDGAVTWSDICPLLESKLRQQGLTPAATGSGASKGIGPSAVRIRYIVLGAESSFYVKFDNGRMEWCGQDSFGDILRKGVNDRRLLVDKVAFGQSGGWLVLWSDGSFDSEGMPQTLMDRLRRHHKSSSVSPRTTIIEARTSGIALGIKDVTVGPTGEWFIIYKDHSVQADNLPDALYKSLSQIREKAGRVRSITFGENRSWFVRYWDANK